MSEIYKGYNPIFESLKRQVFEQENKIDLDALDKTIYSTFIQLIQGGSNQDLKTPEGFKNYMDGTLLKASSLDGFQNEILKKFDERIASEPVQKDSLTALKEYISQLFATLKTSLGEDATAFKGLVNKMSDYAKSTEGDLLKLKVTLQEREDFVTKYLSEQKSESASSDDGIKDYKADTTFATYKFLADLATSFQGEMSNVMSNQKLSQNQDVQKFSGMASKYVEDAKKLAITKDGSLLSRVRTQADGKLNRKQYREKCAELYNEILRQRQEWRKVYGRLTNVPPPPPQAVVCPAGSQWDKNANACVLIPTAPVKGGGNNGSGGNSGNGNGNNGKKKSGGSGSSNTGGGSKACTFPVAVGSPSCGDVKNLQSKMSGFGTCIDDILKANGGIDGKYGSVTAKLANIIYAYITGSKTFSDTGELTKDMYEKIVNSMLKESFVYTIDNKKFDSLLEKNLFVKEYESGTPVISFKNFSKILEQASTTSKRTFSDCVCETYKTGKISDECASVKKPVIGGGGDTGGNDGGDGKDKGGDKKWKGLKPPQSGIYFISYDESTSEVLVQSAVVAVGVTAVVLTVGAAIGAYAPAAVGEMAVNSTIAADGATALGNAFTGTKLAALGVGLSASTAATIAGAAGGAVLAAPVAIGAGAAAGLGTAWWGTRTNVGISTVGGFISRTGMRKIVRGMTDTTDGLVYKEDLTAIMATLCLLKGTWTANAERNKALSGWGEFKRLYAKENKIDIKSEVIKIGTKTVRDCQNFPEFDEADLSEGESVNADDAKTAILEAIDRLDQNESNILDNIKDFTEDDINKIYEGTKIAKKDGGTSTKETKDAKKEKTADGEPTSL